MNSPLPTFRSLLPTSLLALTLSVGLAACGRVDTPTPGTYRAFVKLRGGEVPFELQVSAQQGQTVMGVLHDGEVRPLTNLQMKDGALDAQLPDGAGMLHATIGPQDLQGEVRFTDHLGAPQTLPFTADRRQTYQFIADASTDNADVSGYWQLEAISPQHFSAPVTVQLQQRFDAVDGQLRLPDGNMITLLGQVHGDDLYLSALGQGRALLFKGKVNQHGELQGELWTNLSNAQPWVAKRVVDDQVEMSAQGEPVRQVTLPWALPTQ
ncbi:MAG: hypothetical protein QM808_07595 [Steroidobacteraceae bacterium]